MKCSHFLNLSKMKTSWTLDVSYTFHPRHHVLLRLRLVCSSRSIPKRKKKSHENQMFVLFFQNIPFWPQPLCVKFKPLTISFAMMNGFRYPSLNIIGQYGVDFHSGTIRVQVAFSLRTFLIVSKIKFGGGTNQLFSEDQSKLKAFIPLLPVHQHFELNMSHFLL